MSSASYGTVVISFHDVPAPARPLRLANAAPYAPGFTIDPLVRALANCSFALYASADSPPAPPVSCAPGEGAPTSPSAIFAIGDDCGLASLRRPAASAAAATASAATITVSTRRSRM